MHFFSLFFLLSVQKGCGSPGKFICEDLIAKHKVGSQNSVTNQSCISWFNLVNYRLLRSYFQFAHRK
ncbi:hypothetical protein I7I48_08847 [Histoplasma ohiense]|nr:hypothetical protein I7I48_08847 [Histoplasma ohiense (nom. inval.)]